MQVNQLWFYKTYVLHNMWQAQVKRHEFNNCVSAFFTLEFRAAPLCWGAFSGTWCLLIWLMMMCWMVWGMQFNDIPRSTPRKMLKGNLVWRNYITFHGHILYRSFESSGGDFWKECYSTQVQGGRKSYTQSLAWCHAQFCKFAKCY